MGTKKVILNKCYGGFGVSDKAYQLYAKKKGLQLYRYELILNNNNNNNNNWKYKKVEKRENYSFLVNYFTKDLGDIVEISNEDYDKYNIYLSNKHREDSVLIEVIEELGEEASGSYGKLVIVEIPDYLEYVIDEHDGLETLHEKVQEW